MFDIGDQIDRVATLIRTIATVEVLDRFRALEADDVDEKSPGDLVTIADRACERVLGQALRDIHDAPVVGEEATADNPNLVEAVETSPHVWIVDPVDGTGNFVAGSEDFAVMVAFAEAGLTTAAWIWLPTTDRMVTACRGGGTWSDGERVHAPTSAPDHPGILKLRYVPEASRADFRRVAGTVTQAPDRRCAGVEYLDLIDGASSFLAYWRTKPWDHAPGTLLATEAGLRAARFDGSPYRPGDDRTGLLTADAIRWDRLGPALAAASGPVIEES